METKEKEINTAVFFIAKVGNAISDLFMTKAMDMLGHINVEEVESGVSALKYHGQLTLDQRDKFDEFCHDHNAECIYIEYDKNVEDNVTNLCIATYE